jgi:hypothetical protein
LPTLGKNDALGVEVHACKPSTWGTEAEGLEFKMNLVYIVRTCLKTKQNKTKIKKERQKKQIRDYYEQLYSNFFFFFGGTEVCTQGFGLAKQVLCCLSHISNLFLLWLF